MLLPLLSQPAVWPNAGNAAVRERRNSRRAGRVVITMRVDATSCPRGTRAAPISFSRTQSNGQSCERGEILRTNAAGRKSSYGEIRDVCWQQRSYNMTTVRGL